LLVGLDELREFLGEISVARPSQAVCEPARVVPRARLSEGLQLQQRGLAMAAAVDLLAEHVLARGPVVVNLDLAQSKA
jgi:hypothetical protein